MLLGSARTYALSSLNQLKDILRPASSPSDIRKMTRRGLKRVISNSGLFDVDYYYDQFAQDAKPPADPIDHYIDAGEAEGKCPNEFFDPAWYAAQRSTGESEGLNQLVHYVLVGKRQGMAPGLHFDPEFYLREYPDVAAVRIDPLLHYLEIGRIEGREPTAGRAVLKAGAWFAIAESIDVASDPGLDDSLSRACDEAAGALTTLHLLHRGGGGTERHVAEITRVSAKPEAHVVLLAERRTKGFRASLLFRQGDAWRRFNMESVKLEALALVLSRLKARRLHIHQAGETLRDLNGLIDVLGTPVDVTIHDYSLLCPRNSFVDVNGRYCGEPDERGCLQCLKQAPQVIERDIAPWRAAGVDLLRRADRIVCPTNDAAQRIRRYVPQARTIVVPHSTVPISVSLVSPNQKSDRIRVAVLGTLSEHKGGHFLIDCVEASNAAAAPIDWIAIGSFAGSVTKRAYRVRDRIKVTGAYDARQLHDLLTRLRPDLLFFPQHCVETYSYALSEAMGSGLPILAPDLGAFPERLAGVANGRLYPSQQSPAEVVADIVDLCRAVSARRTTSE